MGIYGVRLYLIAIAALIAGALLGVRPDNSLAQQKTSQQEVAESGRPLYEQHCATCHGRTGKGDGPAATMLTVKPADLTQLSKKNKGNYPFWQVYDVIDGRTLTKGHGDREMPIWGQALTLGTGALAGSQVRTQILALVHYLESIQAK